MKTILPDLEEHMSEGDMTTWLTFFQLVIDGIFPEDNICYSLFKDIVRFYSYKNVQAMRYTPQVKQFWALGLILFKGKFIRFMTGFKCVRGLNEQEKRTADANINFAVPSTNILASEVKESVSGDCLKPGIIKSNISAFSEHISNTVSCKLCFDGKKVAIGFGKNLGEVDVFGCQELPTLAMKQEKLLAEKKVFEDMSSMISTLEDKSRETVDEILPDDNEH